MAFLLLDGAIAVSFALERRGDALLLVSAASVILLAVMVAAIILMERGKGMDAPTALGAGAVEEDLRALASEAEAFLKKSQMYLDTDLSVVKVMEQSGFLTRSNF